MRGSTTSFMPARSYTSPADFIAHFDDWLARANRRPVRTLGAATAEIFGAARPPTPSDVSARHSGRTLAATGRSERLGVMLACLGERS